MRKKNIAIFAPFCFAFFCFSCTATRGVKVEKGTDLPGKGAAITGIQKKSGEYVKFVKGGRGRIEGGFITGLLDNQPLELKRADFVYTEESWENRVKKYSLIKTNDGKTYKVFAAEEKGDLVRFRVRALASFPISEVKFLWVKKFDPWRTFIAVICGAVPAAALVALMLARLWGS